jgi:5-methylcytosine-specific restriction endonuclease McrA
MKGSARKLSSAEWTQLCRLRDRAFFRQKGLCHWCSRPMVRKSPDSNPLQLTGDHVTPLYAGGHTIPGNVVAACLECNNSRNPETNRGKGGLVATAGNAEPVSPFACLKGATP